MSLSKEQVASLLELVASARPDAMTCDACFDRIADFAEAELRALSICEALAAVKHHLSQCPCCQDEYQALLAGLQAIEKGKCGP